MPPFRIHYQLLLIAALGLAASCGEKDPVALPVGVAKAEGVPVYYQSSKTLGPEGGAVSSADGQVTLRVPPGALTHATDLAISPVSNTAFLGVGNGYRLFPRGLRLKKPATLQFNYAAEEIDGSSPEALRVARQDEAGIWQAHNAATLDTTRKTLSLPIGQLGDWSVFRLAAIVPNQLALRPGQGAALRAWQIPGGALLASLPADRTLPLGEPIPAATGEVTGWSVDGDENYRSGPSGTMNPAMGGVSFTAPAQAPARNPVELEAGIRLGRTAVSLLARITIGGITAITLNGGPFREQEITFTRCVGAVTSGGSNTVLTAANGTSEMQLFYPWYNPGAFPFDEQGGVCGVSINLDKASSRKENFLRSSSLSLHTGETIPATGTLRVSSYGEIGGLITGTFAGKVWYRTEEGPPIVVEVRGRFSATRIL